MFSVYNELGFGHKESVYQEALVKEFDLLKLQYRREVKLPVKYKESIVGSYRPDFIVGGKIIIEVKSLYHMPNITEQQLLQYLKITGFKLGLLVNFGTPKLYIKRLIWG
jgi:GxxExxY protein